MAVPARQGGLLSLSTLGQRYRLLEGGRTALNHSTSLLHTNRIVSCQVPVRSIVAPPHEDLRWCWHAPRPEFVSGPPTLVRASRGTPPRLLWRLRTGGSRCRPWIRGRSAFRCRRRGRG